MVASNDIVMVEGKQKRGRKYPWGTILIEEKSAFNDFLLLRELLVEEMLLYLKDKTALEFYEAYRRQQIEKNGLTHYTER